MRDRGKLSHDELQQLDERSVFERFCAVRGLAIIELTQPTAPAPDIIASLGNGVGVVGFELVCVDDSEYQKRFAMMPRTTPLLEQHHHALDSESRTRFDTRFHDARISVTFDQGRGLRDIKAALPRVFCDLMSLPQGCTGVAMHSDVQKTPCVDHVYIGRHESVSGPEFCTQSGGLVSPLHLDKLRVKLAKTYTCEAPVELLVHAVEVAHLADDQKITAILDELMPASIYRSVWILEDMQRKVFCYARP